MRTILLCFFTGGLFLTAAAFFLTFPLQEKGPGVQEKSKCSAGFSGQAHDPKPPETAPKLP